MKKHFKFLAFVWLGAVAMLLLLEMSQFRKVDRLRGEIGQSYDLISGRDEGLRLELEFRRLQSRLYAYIHQDLLSDFKGERKPVSHDDVLIWFDIFWSRVHAMDRKKIGLSPQFQSKLNELIVDLQETLQEVDPLIASIEPYDIATYAEIKEKFGKYDAAISSIASAVAQNRTNRASELKGRLEQALKSMDVLLYTSGVGGALILTLLGAEAYRARRDERKTKSREAHVRFLAEHDSLTGLGNRSYLNDKMAQYIKEANDRGSSFQVLLLDLDKFKDVNDTFGHPMGDRLLKKVAARLVGIFDNPDDIIVRLGGDEFAILVKSDLVSATRSAKEVIDALTTVFELSKFEIRISTSIGISSYPQLSSTVDDLMRDADLALYEAKNRGRQTFSIYKKEMSIAIQQRVMLEADLRRALEQEDGGLEVYYQPQVTFDGDGSYRDITGVEALVRWFHPERGQIPTIEFINIAETAGIIDELSDWIVRQACADVVSWHRAGFMLNLSVNLSPIQLNNPKLPEELLSHLDGCGFDPRYLTLEITESTDVQDTEAAAKMLALLADKGISLAMDDFGTGYSNLGYLKSLPLHTLKIDRSFVMQIVDDEEERKLVRGIINLAQGMGLKVIAEGVETEQQFAFLKSENCDTGQGYLFGRPMHKLGMLSLLNEQYDRNSQVELRLEA